MALKIDRGLFTTDFIDHHAVLGVSVDADPKDIHKRYLKIARQLHPDSSAAKSTAEKQLAQELLSKFVNPAYEKLSKSKDYKEYTVLLELKGKSLNQQQETVLITSTYAQKVASSSNIAQAYHEVLESLSSKQYESLNDSADLIGHISELNMVYLMRQTQDRTPPKPQSPITDKDKGDRPPDPPRSIGDDLVEKAIKRAVQFESNGDLPKAIQELREAIQMNPRNPKVVECHSRLGMIYLNSKQPTMAKIHFKKALELNPNDTIAQAGMNRLEPKGKNAPPAKNGKGKDKGNSSGGGGLFSGLFGKKR